MTTSEPATMDTAAARSWSGRRPPRRWPSHLDLHTAGDLIYHFPRRYDERGEHTDIRSLDVGEQVTVLAQVQSQRRVRPMRQRRGNLLEVTVGDGSGGTLTLTFFGNQAWRERELRPGRWGLFAGKVTEFRGKRQLNRPEYVLLGEGGEGEAAAEEVEEFAGALIPVYPAAAAVPTWVIARCVRVVLDTAHPAGRSAAGRRCGPAASWSASAPRCARSTGRPARRQLYRARRRLKWDEAFAVQLTLVQRKRRAAAWPATAAPGAGPAACWTRSTRRLPYELTAGQRDGRRGDRRRPGPAAPDAPAAAGRGRLRQDGGARCGRCCRWSTPAARRRCSPRPRCSPPSTTAASATCSAPLGRAGELDGDPTTRTRVALVTGSLGAAARRRALAEVADGAAGIVVGTHALLYEGVDFADLGLVVVDEQHRFGVEQRDALRAKADAAAARAGHDRDADPAHGGHDRLRRPGDLHAVPAAAGPVADRLARGAGGREAGLPGPGLAAAARGGRRPATRRTWSARGSATGRRRDEEPPPRTATTAGGRRWRCPRWRRCSPRGRCTGCGSASCTAGCPPTRRTR